MIQRIASILKDRIAAFTYVDKIGGLTRVAIYQREGTEIKIPVAGDVDEALACDPSTVRDMVPDDRYGCIVYFEDRGTTRETSRTRGTFYSASLRLVCWINTAKFGSDPVAADRILEQFTNDLNVGQSYNTDTLIGLKHLVSGIPQRGASIFSQYTYPEAARQYLLWPFDAFALDITATYRIKPGCEEEPVPDDDACWTAPTTRKRMNPNQFTCDELLDPVTGLTAEQLGPDCLDCNGGGGPCDPATVTVNTDIEYATENSPCGAIINVEVVNEADEPVGSKVGNKIVVPSAAPTTVNGTQSTTPTILVQQGGVNVGTLNPATGVHTVPACPSTSVAVTVNDTAFDTATSSPFNVPVLDGTGTAVGSKVGTDWVVPTAKSLCELVTEGTSAEVATCVTASGKRPGVLAELIPTVDEADTVAQVYDVMTHAQQDLFDVTVQLVDSADDPIGVPDVYSAGTTTTKTAPDGTVSVVDHLAQPLGSTTVKSNSTATVVVSDWEGEYPVLTENTPTYNDEGDSIAGWTVTGGSMASSASVNRLTQASTAAAASASRAVTMPTANGDWALYARIRARRTTGDAQLLAIDGTGSERAFIYFNFNTTLSCGTGSAHLGTISIRGTNAAGTPSNAVYATGVFMDTNWQDVCLLYNHARLSFSIYIRQTDGSWLFGAQVNGTFFGAQIRLLANNTTTVGSWIEYDFLTLVAPNIQSIGDSLTQGATLFSPVVASALTNGASTWQRWAPLYPALRNNLIVNKGVGSNTTAMVAARIAADCIDMGAKLVLLSACNNDLGASITQAQRTTNTQTSISLCTAASIPVVLYNATYATAAFSGQPASLNYYRTWWKDYRPTLTGLSGSIDTMGALKDPNGYADTLFTQSDNIHPNVTGYTRMGEWIAALPYA